MTKPASPKAAAAHTVHIRNASSGETACSGSNDPASDSRVTQAAMALMGVMLPR